ncbi:hypothetical protein ABTB38_18050, partial [Acinetobacter baumannii]
VDGRWLQDKLSVPAILDAGMGPDGKSLVVSASTGRLRLVNPETFSVGFSLDYPAGFARGFTYLSWGIPASNNGRSWLPAGDGNWNELAYFDHRSKTMQ